MTIVVDCNVVVSAARIGGVCRNLIDRVVRRHKIVLSEPILTEYETVAERPRHALYRAVLRANIAEIERLAVFVEPGSVVFGLRVCINPLEDRPLDFGAPRVAALVVLTEPGNRPKLNTKLVAEALGLTTAESQVAVVLSEGMTARDIAMTTNRQASTIYSLIKRAYRKLGISRQADPVRLILSLADASAYRG